MKRAGIFALLLLSGILFSSGCASADDENYLWLLAVAGGESGEGTSGEVPFEVEVGDETGSPDFLFDSTRTLDIYVNVLDPVSPVSGSQVRIYELVDGVPTQNVAFRARTGVDGIVTGSMEIDRNIASVLLEVEFEGQVYSAQVDITYVQSIRRTINLLATITPIEEVDSDGDGIPDEEDDYPEDADRATVLRYPREGNYTVAFEDLYPRQGDADFNDYVLRVNYEEDLNANGDVVRIRGNYEHVARGAGYKHTLRLTLPGVTDAHLNLTRFDRTDGSIAYNFEGTIADFTGIEMMPRSDTTITGSNTGSGGTYRAGDRAQFEVVLGHPAQRAQLGALPYDLHLHVLDTGHDIHFLGRYFKADGTDQYLDSSGFPWALMVPGDWRWPYERQNIHAGYEFFDDWYQTGGLEANDWYDTFDDSLVVPTVD